MPKADTTRQLAIPKPTKKNDKAARKALLQSKGSGFVGLVTNLTPRNSETIHGLQSGNNTNIIKPYDNAYPMIFDLHSLLPHQPDGKSTKSSKPTVLPALGARASRRAFTASISRGEKGSEDSIFGTNGRFIGSGGRDGRNEEGFVAGIRNEGGAVSSTGMVRDGWMRSPSASQNRHNQTTASEHEIRQRFFEPPSSDRFHLATTFSSPTPTSLRHGALRIQTSMLPPLLRPYSRSKESLVREVLRKATRSYGFWRLEKKGDRYWNLRVTKKLLSREFDGIAEKAEILVS